MEVGREGLAARRANPSGVVDHPLRLERVELAVRPWRTATVAIAAVAAIELVLLVIAGGALLTRAEPGTAAEPVRLAKQAVPAPAKRATAAPSSPKLAADLPRRRVEVVVLNGNGRAGAAAAIASRVSRRGYRIGTVGNAASHDYPRSIVMYRRGFAAEGKRLAHDLGVAIVSPLDGMRPGELAGAHAVLILGG